MKDITKKNYIYEDREYGDVRRRRDKVEVQGREIPQSEFDQPYLKNNEEDDTYQSYEWDFPDMLPWPPWVDYPPPGEIGPCSAKDGCGFIEIIRDYPSVIECGGSFWFRTIHEVHGCAVPPGAWVLVWGASAGDLDQGTVVGAKWTAPECCHGDEVVISVSSIWNDCYDEARIQIQCECCSKDMEIYGPETTNPGNTYKGDIIPACPGAKAYVSSNSNCNDRLEATITDEGDYVYVDVASDAGGSFEIQVVDQNEGCDVKAYKSVRINHYGDPQPSPSWVEIAEIRSPDISGFCPGSWFDQWYPLAAGRCSTSSHVPGSSCGPCTNGRYKYDDIWVACCAGWSWADGTEWEKETYFYSTDPCNFNYDLPCGCSKLAICGPADFMWVFQARTHTGETGRGYTLYEWKANCT
jgi:hypothetical protein